MNNVIIASAVRTPIGNFGGALKNVPAYDLGALVLNEVIRRIGIESKLVDLVIMGQNYQSGEYVNCARMALLKAGWAEEVPAFTIDRRCPSSLDALCQATMTIQTGNAEVVVAGGVESMSTAELYVKGDMRWGIGGTGGTPKGHGSLSTWGIPLYDRIQRARVMSQPEERYGILPSMMSWAETAAKEHGISRQDVDRWAFLSNRRACAAIASGKFKEETVPVPVSLQKDGPVLFSQDERPRPDTTEESLSKLKPVLGGVCTAGNSSGENDGASACVLMSEEKAKELGCRPMAYIRSFAMSGADPRRAWKAASTAVTKSLSKAGLCLGQMDLIELHEAFAAQVLANFIELGVTERDYEKVNVNGSCISLGHPLGATGVRILTILLHEMQRHNARYGLEAVCGGGGQGTCAIVERK